MPQRAVGNGGIAGKVQQPRRVEIGGRAGPLPVKHALVGVYRGTVVDDDQTVTCVTTFLDYHGQRIGKYVIRDGDDRYEGTLDAFKLLSDDQGECQFQWHDKHGTGTLTIRVTPDGHRFAGSWGLAFVQDELVWTGQREHLK